MSRKTVLFRDMTICSLAKGSYRFRRICFLYLQDTELHSITFQTML